jgi:hypothetical protein
MPEGRQFLVDQLQYAKVAATSCGVITDMQPTRAEALVDMAVSSRSATSITGSSPPLHLPRQSANNPAASCHRFRSCHYIWIESSQLLQHRRIDQSRHTIGWKAAPSAHLSPEIVNAVSGALFQSELHRLAGGGNLEVLVEWRGAVDDLIREPVCLV